MARPPKKPVQTSAGTHKHGLLCLQQMTSQTTLEKWFRPTAFLPGLSGESGRMSNGKQKDDVQPRPSVHVLLSGPVRDLGSVEGRPVRMSKSPSYGKFQAKPSEGPAAESPGALAFLGAGMGVPYAGVVTSTEL